MNHEFAEAVHVYVTGLLRPISKTGLYVDTSWLADGDPHFKGLFANSKIFRANDVVTTYQGVCLNTADALRLVDKTYLMRLGQQCYVDAQPCPLIFARYINDCINPAGYNVRFEKHPEMQCAHVVALRDIHPGEEIFVDYGKWYWASAVSKPFRLSFSALIAHRGVIK